MHDELPMRGHDMSEMKAPLHVAVTLPRAWAAYIAELEARVAELEHSTKAGDRDYPKLVNKHDAALKRIAELEAQRNTLTEACAAHNRVIGQQAAEIEQLRKSREMRKHYACVCKFEADGETIISMCNAHKEHFAKQAARIMELEAEVCEVAGSREDDLFHLLDDLFHLRTDRDEVLAERDARIAELELELAGWRDGVFVHLSMEKANVADDRDPGPGVLDVGRAVASAFAMPQLGGPVTLVEDEGE